MVFSFHFLENSTREINKNHALCSFIPVQHLRKLRRKSHEQFLRSVPFWENCTIKSTKTPKIRKCDHFGYFGNFEVFAAHEFHVINCYGRFGGAKNHPKGPPHGFGASRVRLEVDCVGFGSRKPWEITKIAEINENEADARRFIFRFFENFKTLFFRAFWVSKRTRMHPYLILNNKLAPQTAWKQRKTTF